MESLTKLHVVTDEVLFEVINHVGWITLNRQKALNSLSYGMIQQMSCQLTAWKVDPKVKAVVIQGAGDKAFCAGGDIRAVYDAWSDNSRDNIKRKFFYDEYCLNYLIHTYPKPYVALINGVAMGGGLGVSVHGSHRVVTDKAMIAMPETGIGYFPDVGGTFFLSRCPGHVGMYLGLTGARINGVDALYAGLATHSISHEQYNSLVSDLHNIDWSVDPEVSHTRPEWLKSSKSIQSRTAFNVIDHILNKYHLRVGVGSLDRRREQIDLHFGKSALRDIYHSLEQSEDEWARDCAVQLAQKSPISLYVTYRALRGASLMTIENALNVEFRLSQSFMADEDFFEGVRALLVDKDKKPRWKFATIEDVPYAYDDVYFDSLKEGELQLS